MSVVNKQMRKAFAFAIAVCLIICCFAGCQKPLTEEEKALKELQDAWNAMVVEKTETVKTVTWHKAIYDAVIWHNTNADDIAKILQIFAAIDTEKFQLEEVALGGSMTMLTLCVDFDEEANANGVFIPDARLSVDVMENGAIRVTLRSDAESRNEPVVTAYCTEHSLQYEALMEQLEELNFEA